jgi:hypothetical protein
LFERFTNPVWHFVSTLDKDRQIIAALIITPYRFCRTTVNETLVSPLETRGLISPQHTLKPGIRERLIDEALIGLLKSCSTQNDDLRGICPDWLLPHLPEVWGMFALEDRNYRLKCAGPQTLEGTFYSSDRDEARTQVLVKWAEILEISEPDFVSEANKGGFYEEWNNISIAFLGGLLKGVARIPNDILLRKARSEAENIPNYRIDTTRYTLERIAKMLLTPDLMWVEPKHPAPQPVHDTRGSSTQVAVGNPNSRLHGVKRYPDGRTDILLSPDGDAVDFIRSMIVFMRPHLRPQYVKVVERWVSDVTGRAIVEGHWTQEHEDTLVRGYERFCWEGDAESEAALPALSTIKSAFRKKYPSVAGTRIDVPLNTEMRCVFRSWISNNATEANTTLATGSAKQPWLSNRQVQAQRPVGSSLPNTEGSKRTPPEIPVDMLSRGRHHRENQFRGIADWEQQMVNEFGKDVIPMLGSIWDRTS